MIGLLSRLQKLEFMPIQDGRAIAVVDREATGFDLTGSEAIVCFGESGIAYATEQA
jgi:hypothetical protein